jgi:hypothetical protein
MGNTEHSPTDVSMKRRRLLALGTLVTAFTGASTLSAQAAPGDKTQPNSSYVPVAEKGAASGVATLDAASKIPYGQLPDQASLTPRAFGAQGDGAANDSAAMVATLTAAAPGAVIDLSGRTFNLGQTLNISKPVTLRNGTLTCAVDRVATVTAAGVRMENVQFVRTGPGTPNSGALTLNAANCVLTDVSATSTCGEGLRLGNGACNGTQVRGGYYASSDPNDSYAIQLLSGTAHNYDVNISRTMIRNTGYGTGIGLFNCSRCTVEHNDVRGMRRSPWFTATGWTQVSGTVFKTRDRSDVASNAVYVNDVEYRKNPNAASTEPDLNRYTTPGDGYLYLNSGNNPAGQTVKTTRTNGYGILFYSTSSESEGMKDNLAAHNYVEDTDGIGIYFQTLMNIPRNNHTLHNTLRNVCLTGVTVGDLPFAGIGIFGGFDIQLDGDMIDGAGSASTPAPGIDIKASVGVAHMTGSIKGVSVVNAKGHGISLAPGTWRLSGVSASYNGGSGITHGTLTSTDVLDVTLDGCVSTNNAANGAYFETTTPGEIRPRFIGGRYTDNTARNIALARCRDVYIGSGILSGGAGNIGINIASSNQRVVVDGVFLRSGVGLAIPAGIADLTVTNVVSDGSAGTKVNITGPYKVGGSTGTVTDWRCSGIPEGQVAAAVGSRCTRVDGGAGSTLYIKESGSSTAGWVAK